MQICYIPYKNDYQVYVERKLNKEVKSVKDKKQRYQLAGCILLLATNSIKTLGTTLEENNLMIEVFQQQVDAVGMQLLNLMRSIAYWFVIVMAVFEIVKQLHKQDVSGIVAISVKYGIMYSILYILPWIFKLIQSLFPV